MAELYGSPEGVKELLTGVEGEAFPADQSARIGALLATVSALIEEETGRVFGDATPPSETLIVEGTGVDKLFLPKGIRILTAATENPEWNGTAWINGTTLVVADYRLAGLTINGAYRHILRVDGIWGGSYVLTGVWEDQVPTVPTEITYLANYLSAEIWKKQKASPAGFVGPDGAVVPVRNTFNEPEVKMILDKHRLNSGIWFF